MNFILTDQTLNFRENSVILLCFVISWKTNRFLFKSESASKSHSVELLHQKF